MPGFLVLLLPALVLLWGLTAFVRRHMGPSDEELMAQQSRLDSQTLAAGAFLYYGSQGGDGGRVGSDGGYSSGSGGDGGYSGGGDGGGGGSW